MTTMHTDMAGGRRRARRAARWCAGSRLPVRVTALVPAAENSLSGSAYRPATSCGTSAAGPARSTTPTPRDGSCSPMRWPTRSRGCGPTSLVDVATLTGAMKVALGTAHRRAVRDLRRRSPAALLAAGAATGEPLWRHADAGGVRVGARLAGRRRDERAGQSGRRSPRRCSCSPFTGGVPWAHLDIAGPGARRPRTTGS